MARARNIKPGFFSNDVLAEIDPLGRLLFIGLWTLADREGRLEDRPLRIKVLLLPYDNCDVNKLLQDLHNAGFVTRYSVGNSNYIQVVNFVKHQNPHHKEAASVIPPPPGHKLKGARQDTTTKEQRQRIFDRDGRKCVNCGTHHNLTIDHIIPLIKGGSSEDNNLQTLCKRCNLSKKDSTLNQPCVKHEPSMTTQASACPADSLNLIPDSLNLIPDSLNSDSPLPNSGPAILDSAPSVTTKKRREEMFNLFWQAYPNKKSKGQAEKAWDKLPLTEILFTLIMSKLTEARSSPNWAKEGGRFIPYPATWLNAKGWEDEYTQVMDVPDAWNILAPYMREDDPNDPKRYS